MVVLDDSLKCSGNRDWVFGDYESWRTDCLDET
jgi:hypothetical protein